MTVSLLTLILFHLAGSFIRHSLVRSLQLQHYQSYHIMASSIDKRPNLDNHGHYDSLDQPPRTKKMNTATTTTTTPPRSFPVISATALFSPQTAAVFKATVCDNILGCSFGLRNESIAEMNDSNNNSNNTTDTTNTTNNNKAWFSPAKTSTTSSWPTGGGRLCYYEA